MPHRKCAYFRTSSRSTTSTHVVWVSANRRLRSIPTGALRAILAVFPDGGGKVDADPNPENLVGRRVISGNGRPCVQRTTAMATGETLDLQELRFAFATSNIGSRTLMQPLDRPRQLLVVRRTSQVGLIVDIQTEFLTFDSCKMAVVQVLLR
jgi:hypothetical protein